MLLQLALLALVAAAAAAATAATAAALPLCDEVHVAKRGVEQQCVQGDASATGETCGPPTCSFETASECHDPAVHALYRNPASRPRERVQLTFVTFTAPWASKPLVTRERAAELVAMTNQLYSQAGIEFELDYVHIGSDSAAAWSVLWDAESCVVGDGQCQHCNLYGMVPFGEGGDCPCQSIAELAACARVPTANTPHPANCACPGLERSVEQCAALAGNGRCDWACNRAAANWDGGDCCDRSVQRAEQQYSCHRDWLDSKSYARALYAAEPRVRAALDARALFYVFGPWVSLRGGRIIDDRWPWTLVGGAAARTDDFLYGLFETANQGVRYAPLEPSWPRMVHELGHVFGLFHTHQNMECGNPCRGALAEAPGAAADAGWRTGDFIADTGAEQALAGYAGCDVAGAPPRDTCDARNAFAAAQPWNIMSYGDCSHGGAPFTVAQLERVRCNFERYMMGRSLAAVDVDALIAAGARHVLRPEAGETLPVGAEYRVVLAYPGRAVRRWLLVPSALHDPATPGKHLESTLFDITRQVRPASTNARDGAHVWRPYSYDDTAYVLRKHEYVLVAVVAPAAGGADIVAPSAPFHLDFSACYNTFNHTVGICRPPEDCARLGGVSVPATSGHARCARGLDARMQCCQPARQTYRLRTKRKPAGEALATTGAELAAAPFAVQLPSAVVFQGAELVLWPAPASGEAAGGLGSVPASALTAWELHVELVPQPGELKSYERPPKWPITFFAVFDTSVLRPGQFVVRATSRADDSVRYYSDSFRVAHAPCFNTEATPVFGTCVASGADCTSVVGGSLGCEGLTAGAFGSRTNYGCCAFQWQNEAIAYRLDPNGNIVDGDGGGGGGGTLGSYMGGGGLGGAGATVGAVLGVIIVLLVLLALAITCVVVRRRRRDGGGSSGGGDFGSDDSGAYPPASRRHYGSRRPSTRAVTAVRHYGNTPAPPPAAAAQRSRRSYNSGSGGSGSGARQSFGSATAGI